MVQAWFLVDFSFAVRATFNPDSALTVCTFGEYALDHAPAVVVCAWRGFEPSGKLEIIVTGAKAEAFLQKEAELLSLKKRLGKDAEVGRLTCPQTLLLEDYVDPGLYFCSDYEPAAPCRILQYQYHPPPPL